MQGKWLTNSRVGWDGYIQITEQQNIRIKNDNVSLLICLFLLPFQCDFSLCSLISQHLALTWTSGKTAPNVCFTPAHPNAIQVLWVLKLVWAWGKLICVCRAPLPCMNLPRRYTGTGGKRRNLVNEMCNKKEWLNILDKVIQCGWSVYEGEGHAYVGVCLLCVRGERLSPWQRGLYFTHSLKRESSREAPGF